MAWKFKATRTRIQNLSKVSKNPNVEEIDDDKPPTHMQVTVLVTKSELELPG
jgi:hypothetical protein